MKFEYKPTFTAQSKRKQEQQDEGHGEQNAFGKADVGDPRLRWYTVTELSKFICELCAREMQMSKTKVLGQNSKFNPTSCVNCCANWNADTNGIARSIEGKKMYTRLFAEYLFVDDLLAALRRSDAHAQLALMVMFFAAISAPILWKKVQFQNGLTWCGWRINFLHETIELTPEKTLKLKGQLHKLLKAGKVKRKLLEQVLDLLI